MRLFGREVFARPVETRNTSLENPSVPVSSDSFLQFFGVDTGNLPAVTPESALKVPAVVAAVSFLSRSLANLPLHAYQVSGAGSKRLGGSVQRILNEAPNPEWTSFGLRQYFWQQVFLGGRGLAWMEMQGSTLIAIWPMDATKTTVKRVNGRKVYRYNGKDYAATEVIDVPFMLKADQLGSHSPLVMGKEAIGLALAMGKYASGFFAGGGVPPLALVGTLPVGADAIARAKADIKRSIDAAKESGSPVFPIPPNYKLEPVGFDPGKGQMTEARRLQIEELARIWQLPPVFVQDLTHGTFSNTEQQDLHLVKHLLSQWAKALEEELNLKIFGAVKNRKYVEHSLDAMMRGDFKSRIEAMGTAINTAQMMPDEARALENRPPVPGANQLFMQSGTQPITKPKGGTPPTDGEP